MTILSCETDDSYKEMIIDNASELNKIDSNTFVLEDLDGYYTEISVSFYTDSSFHIICWGDRNSYRWPFKKDRSISVDVPYNRYKGTNVETDVKLIRSLSEFK